MNIIQKYLLCREIKAKNIIPTKYSTATDTGAQLVVAERPDITIQAAKIIHLADYEEPGLFNLIGYGDRESYFLEIKNNRTLANAPQSMTATGWMARNIFKQLISHIR